jgi:predicted TIM-barrel fold metal-dependent hydrolase
MSTEIPSPVDPSARGEKKIMSLPFDGVGIIDTMIDIPDPNRKSYEFLHGLLRGKSAAEDEAKPVSYMFKDTPSREVEGDPTGALLGEMDRFGIERGLVELGREGGAKDAAFKKHPLRLIPSVQLDPNEGIEAVRKLERAVRERGARAAGLGPAFVNPQVPANDKKCHPVYAKCIELDGPVFISAGVPGPRVPMAPQHVELFDEVCWFFPELKLVMRHGAEPWEALAVKLMLKWPNLYYSTSGFAPKHYPKAIIDYANTRGADKIIYAGYYPHGLTLERIFGELPNVPFREHVWPKFLRENALRVLGLEGLA